MFGTASLEVKKLLKETYGHVMFNVYLFVPPWIRRGRLTEKEEKTGIYFKPDRELLAEQPSKEEWDAAIKELLEAKRTYDLVVVNDRSIRECVEEIEKAFGLVPKHL
jgi:hypothetical protein